MESVKELLRNFHLDGMEFVKELSYTDDTDCA